MERSFLIQGLNCTTNGVLVEEAVRNIDGVDKIDLDFEKGLLKVHYDPYKLNVNKIIDKIDRMGYKVFLFR